MRSRKLGRALFMLGALALMATYGVADAHAGWRNHGSWGGSRGYGSSGGSSGGSWGSSGGSSGGSWGSQGSHGSRGGLFHRIKTRHRARHGGSWGSSGGSSGGSWGNRGYGSYGSSGGSSGGYRYYSASSGGSRGYVNYGSSGYSSAGTYRSGVIYSGTPAYGSPVMTNPAYGSPVINGNSFPSNGIPANGQPVPAGDPPSPGPTPTGTDASNGVDTAILNLRLPLDAVVYVNGKRTNTEGSFRSYVSRNLIPGKRYTYEVRAEMEQSGKTLARTKVVQLTAGANKTFDMEFDVDQQLITSVTLMVPDNAVVKMGGVPTEATGAMRYFSTATLKEGEKWEDYTVSVTVEQDGKEVTREKVVNVNAGESVSLQFDFDNDERVASR